MGDPWRYSSFIQQILTQHLLVPGTILDVGDSKRVKLLRLFSGGILLIGPLTLMTLMDL